MQRRALFCEVGGVGREEFELVPPFRCSPVICECLVEENPNGKKNSKIFSREQCIRPVMT